MAPAGLTDGTYEDLAAGLTLSRAASLGRAGRFAEAEAALAALPASGRARPAALDLAARLRVQQGKRDEARALWSEAARLDPAEARYAAALGRLEGGRGAAWTGARLARASALLVLALAIASAGLVLGWRSASRASLETAPTPAPGVAQPSRGAKSALAPGIVFDVAGVSARREGGVLVVAFEDGLFGRGTRLTRAGAARLAAVIARLAPHAGLITVTVTGHTDDVAVPAGSRYRDNVALGLARAGVVFEELREAAHLPAATLAVASGGEERPADGTGEDRARWRTVILRISRRSS